MAQTPSGVQPPPKKSKVFRKSRTVASPEDYREAGGLVRQKFKEGIRDGIKDAMNFNAAKATSNCSVIDLAISKGNSLMQLSKKELEDELENYVDFKMTDLRRRYAEPMIKQYTDELQRKRDAQCQVSGDKEYDYAQEELDNAYENLGYNQTIPSGVAVSQAGVGGGNAMIYLAIGAVALLGFFFVKSQSNQPQFIQAQPPMQ